MKSHLVIAFAAAGLLLAGPREAALAQAAAGFGQPAPPGAPAGWRGESGTASYYGPAENGRLSSSGLRFDDRQMTAAHPWLPFGTRVRVTLGGPQRGGAEPGVPRRSVVVTITDRLHSRRRIVDLSAAAARELGIMQRGVAEVTLVPA